MYIKTNARERKHEIVRWWITKHWDQQTLGFFCFCSSKFVPLGTFQTRPQAITRASHLSKFFFHVFSKDVINQAFPKVLGLLAKQKEGWVSPRQDYHLLQEAGPTPGGFVLSGALIKEKPQRALKTCKQPAWLDHLRKKPCGIPETWRQPQPCAAKRGHSSGMG